MEHLGFDGDNPTGWKQAARFNSAVLMAVSLTFISSLVAVLVKTGDIRDAWFFYDGDCDASHVTEVNKALHLLLNLFSTAMVSLTPRVTSNSDLDLMAHEEDFKKLRTWRLASSRTTTT